MRATCYWIVGLFLLGAAGTVSAEHHESALMQEVEAIGDTLAKAMMDNDLETMFSAYADDVISMPNYAPRMDGVAALKQHHAQMTAAGMKIRSFESHPTEVWEAGDQVIEIGTYEIQLDMPGMSGIGDHGTYLTVYVRDAEGALKIRVETWNTDVDPMSMGGHEGGGDEMSGHGGS